MKRNTEQNSPSFINLFLQTYKNKSVTALCFLNCFSELFYNENLESFREMGYQLVNENLGVIVYQDSNIPFLENCFEEIYSICDYFLKEKDYEKLDLIFRRIFEIVAFLPSKTIIDKMNYNIKIIKIIINICCLINNENEFENVIKFEQFQGNRYKSELINIEICSLMTIISLIHIIKFDNKEIINNIFNLIFDKLYEFEKYKTNNLKKVLSPHLITIKCYSLFLNRFCFNYSIKNKCDLLDSFNQFLILFPRAKQLNQFVFTELISFFGFMLSQQYSFFNYYGTNMKLYYKIYNNFDLHMIKSDITLMQYLLTQAEISQILHAQNLLLFSNIGCYNENIIAFLSKNLEGNNNIEISEIENEKILKYNNSVLEFLYLIIRDNLSMEKSAFRNTHFKLKMKDEIYEKLYQNEKDNIKSLVKNEIIHFILGQKNLIKREECIKYLEKNFDENYIELVDEILNNNCEKIVLSNGLIKFSLKKEILNKCDIDNIISFEKRENAIQYMTNFQSKNFDFLNINIIEPLNIKKNLMQKVYQTFYNEKYFDELIEFYNLIYINKEKAKIFYQIFYSNLTKIFSFAFKLCSTDLLEEDFKIKLLEKKNQIKDKQFQKEKNNDNKDNKYLKEKLKNKFKKQNEILILKEKITSINNIIEEDIQNEKEYCVICRQSLSKESNNLENFGKIYFYFSDYITDIMKKKPEDKRKKSRKFVSCNHKVHFKFFNEYIIIHLNKEFECPLCKKLSNIILYDFSDITNNYCDIIKGLNYSEGKIKLDEFYKKEQGDKLKELFISNIITFENYCSKLFHKQILINDFNEDKILLEKTLKLITDDFEEFTMYYSRTSKKQEQIEIWKNILYNLRLLIQYNIIKITDGLLQMINNILKVNKVENFEDLLIKYDFGYIINIYIIIAFILFESNEENKEKIKIIFQSKFLIYFIYIAFIKDNNNGIIDKSFLNNKTEIKKALDLYYLKYKIFLLLCNEKEENININLEQIISIIKLNPDFIYLINSSKKGSYLHYLKEQSLEIPEFKIINLPENGIEFFNMSNGYCSYCNKKILYLFYVYFVEVKSVIAGIARLKMEQKREKNILRFIIR